MPAGSARPTRAPEALVQASATEFAEKNLQALAAHKYVVSQKHVSPACTGDQVHLYVCSPDSAAPGIVLAAAAESSALCSSRRVTTMAASVMGCMRQAYTRHCTTQREIRPGDDCPVGGNTRQIATSRCKAGSQVSVLSSHATHTNWCPKVASLAVPHTQRSGPQEAYNSVRLCTVAEGRLGHASQIRVCSLCTAASRGTARPCPSISCFRRLPAAGLPRLSCSSSRSVVQLWR